MSFRHGLAVRTRAALVALAAGLATGAADTARSEIVVDQEQTSVGGTVGIAVPWYQTFRQTNGNIVSVDLYTRADTGGTVGVELLDGPCGEVLAYGETDVLGNGWANVVFEEGAVSIVPGQSYALRFVAVSGDVAWWRASASDPYPDGALHSGWWDQVCTEPYDVGQWDVVFRTYADDAAVPVSKLGWSTIKALYR